MGRGGSWRGPGSAPPLFLAGEALLLRADEQVFEAMLEEFTSELRGDRKSLATVRSYQGALRQFLDYVADPRYESSTVSSHPHLTP